MGLENEESLESLLVNIRSVVLSSKGGVLLNHLQDDYRKFIGECIPFEKFGYDCLESLIIDASDFVSVKKNSNGQLYAEAVADSSTAHLSSLISKQKGSKGKKDPKPKLRKKNSYGSYRKESDVASSSLNFSTASKSADEKDQEIEELRRKLEKEKSMNEELSFEVTRLQTQLKIANKALKSERNYITQHNYQQSDVKEVQDLKMKLEKEMRINKGYSSEVERVNSLLIQYENSLRVEKANFQKLEEQLKPLQVLTNEKSKKDDEIGVLMKAVEDLNSKLEKEKKLSKDVSSQLIRLNALVKVGQESLSAERDTVKKLKSEIEALQSAAAKETSPVYEYLNSPTNSMEKCKSLKNLSKSDSWDSLLNLLETDSAKQLNSCSNLSPINVQHPVLAVLKSYEKSLSEQMQKFENKINKQNQKLMLMEKTQNRHYSKLDDKIKNCSDSLDIENITQRLLEHPQFLESINFYASDNNLCQSMPSITPLSSQSDNDSEQSFRAASVSTIARRTYGPPQVEAYKAKASWR